MQMSFYNKFCKLWEQLQIKDTLVQFSLESNIKKFAWLLFIVAKLKLTKMHKTSVSEHAALLFWVLRTVVCILPEQVSCGLIANQ